MCEVGRRGVENGSERRAVFWVRGVGGRICGVVWLSGGRGWVCSAVVEVKLVFATAGKEVVMWMVGVVRLLMFASVEVGRVAAEVE